MTHGLLLRASLGHGGVNQLAVALFEIPRLTRVIVLGVWGFSFARKDYVVRGMRPGVRFDVAEGVLLNMGLLCNYEEA